MNKIQNESLSKASTSKPLKRLASLILVLGLLLTIYVEFNHYAALHKHNADDVQANLFVSVPRGARRQVELPDGTKVWLNAASLLKYPSDMADGNRTVELTGEAFFDVDKNVAHPFRVKVRDMCVEVLGTRFNLRNYPEETISRTIVVDGSVKVQHGDAEAVLREGDQAEVDVSPNYKAVINVKNGIDTETITHWTKGLIEFDNNDWVTVLQDLSRAYNVDIQYEGAAPANRFKGSFSLEEPLEQVLRRLDFQGLHATIVKKGRQRMIISLHPGP